MFDQYTRGQQRSRISWPLLALVIVALVVGGWLLLRAKERSDIAEMNSLFEAPPPEIARDKPRLLQLPGMSVEVPGELVISGGYDYGDASRADLKINWTPNTTLASPEDVPNQVEYISQRTGSKAGPVHKITLDRNPAFEVDFEGAARGTLIISTCGDRSIEIFTGGDPISTAQATESFRCAPHPGRLVYHSAAVSPRTGWTQVPDKTTVELTNDHDVHVLLVAAGDSAGVLKAFNRAFELDPAIEHHGVYSIRRGTVHRSDNSVHLGALVTWPCPALAATGYAYISQVGPHGIAEGIALAETGRCLTPTEAAPSY
jgi:hypothetical protein